MASLTPQSLTNFLVPATGNIAGVPQQLTLNANPFEVDFSNIGLNGVPFVPQSVYIDNSKGLENVVIKSQRLSFVCASVPAGVVQTVNFPSVAGDIYDVTGLGSVTIVWTNAPALSPSPNQVSAFITGGTVDATVTNAPDVVLIPAPVFQFVKGTIHAGSTNTGNLTPTVNSTNLRKLIISMSANSTLAVAGTDLLTVNLNGGVIYSENIYFPSLGPSAFDKIEIDFDTVAQNISTGFLDVTLATALTAGIIDVNAYFD